MTRFLLSAAFAATALLAAATARAHEYWVEPSAYIAEPGATINVDLVNGQDFAGSRHFYNAASFNLFQTRRNNVLSDVDGRLGDRPPLVIEAIDEGVTTVAYVSTHAWLRYDAWDKFEEFVANQRYDGALERHVARGLPREGFREAYQRLARSLIAAGTIDPAWRDAPSGLETEIVLLDNPFAGATEMVRAVILRDGVPRPNAPVDLFERAADGSVTVAQLRSDAEGVVALPVRPGHAYLVDATILREPDSALAERLEVVWETLWAALTFGVPEA